MGIAIVLILFAYLPALLVALTYRFLVAGWLGFQRNRLPVTHGTFDAPEVVITLVHGTWAQNADWTRPESRLCQQLGYEFPQVLFHPFLWSGRNTLGARRRAAVALANEIEWLMTTHPMAKHFVIAHSHGGNVALAALYPDISSRFAGLICLATPVIVSRKRHLDEIAAAPHPVIAIVPVFLAAIILHSTILIYMGLGWMAILAVGFFYWPYISSLFEEAISEEICENVPANKVIFVRAIGDEASSAISTAHFLSWMTGRLSTLPFRLFITASVQLEDWREAIAQRHNLIAWTVIWCVGWLLVLGATLSLYPAPEAAPPFVSDWLGPAALLFLLIPVAIYASLWLGPGLGWWLALFCFPVFLLPLCFAAILAGLAIGPEMAFAALVREVTVEPCPPGVWQVAVVSEGDELAEQDRQPGLQHGLVYKSQQALGLIADWITARLAT